MSFVGRSVALLVCVAGCDRPPPAPEGATSTSALPGGSPVLVSPKGTAAPPAAAPGTPPSGAAPVGVLSADVPRVGPKGRFRLPARQRQGYNPDIQLSADGKRVALGYYGRGGAMCQQVWDVSGPPTLVADFPEHTAGVLALSPSGRRLILQENKTVVDVDTRKPVGVLPGYFNYALFKDESTVVYGFQAADYSRPTRRRVTVWDVDRNADAGSFEVPDDRIDVFLSAGGGNELWLFLSGHRLECYDLIAGRLVRAVEPEPEPDPLFKKRLGPTHSGTWAYPGVAPDGSVFSTREGVVQRIYDGRTGKIVGALPDGMYGQPGGFVPGGTRYLGRVGDNLARTGGVAISDLLLCDWKSGRGLAVLTGFPAGQLGIQGAASADGRTIVAASPEGEVLVFDVSAVK